MINLLKIIQGYDFDVKERQVLLLIRQTLSVLETVDKIKGVRDFDVVQGLQHFDASLQGAACRIDIVHPNALGNLAVGGPLRDEIGTLQLLAGATGLLLLADVHKVRQLIQLPRLGRRQLARDDATGHLHAAHNVPLILAVLILGQLGQTGSHELCKQRNNLRSNVLVEEVGGHVQVIWDNKPTGGGEWAHFYIVCKTQKHLVVVDLVDAVLLDVVEAPAGLCVRSSPT